jgi:hypothetical protein
LPGQTSSSLSIATPGSHQSNYGAGNSRAFLVKFDPAGIRQWGTYYGYVGNVGNGSFDVGTSCATDAAGNVYMAGQTNSTLSIATLGSHQSSFVGGASAYLVKFNSAGIRLWGTYYGDLCGEYGNSCATDASGNVYMSGITYLCYGVSSGSSLATAGAHQSFHSGFNTPGGGTREAYLVKFYECLSPTITVNSGAICAGQSFTINPTGANTYTIQGGNAVVSPSISSTYTVIGTNAAGCQSDAFATSSLTVNQCVGITNQNMDIGSVDIYPNPTNGEFRIKLVSINHTYITITNVLGQIIKTQKAELINQIDLNAFDKGIYFINVMDNNQSVYRGSIIKE